MISRRDKDIVKKAKTKRQKTKVVGDMRPMSDALPSLQQLLKDTLVSGAYVQCYSDVLPLLVCLAGQSESWYVFAVQG